VPDEQVADDVRDEISEDELRPPNKDTMLFDVLIEIPKGSRNKYEVDH
jgi:inorganic pyrophosphatase